MQPRTVRVRPARTQTFQEQGLMREKGCVEVSIFGELHAIVQFLPDSNKVLWKSEDMKGNRMKALDAFMNNYLELLRSMNGR